MSPLGKGLGSLIPPKTKILNDSTQAAEGQIMQALISRIKSNPHQPRKNFSPTELEDLIGSIREHGILQPLIVSLDEEKAGNFILIAGERRLRAARILGLEKVPVVVHSAKKSQKLEIALVENVQRQNLNPIEEAQAYKRLSDEFGLRQEEIAKKVGKNRSTIANILRLLQLPQEIQKAVASGALQPSAARVIAGISDPKEQLALLRKITETGFTVRQTEAHGQKRRIARRRDAGLEAKEEELRAALGTKVSISKSHRGGKIIVEFYSDEEMNAIIKKIIS